MVVAGRELAGLCLDQSGRIADGRRSHERREEAREGVTLLAIFGPRRSRLGAALKVREKETKKREKERERERKREN